MTMVKPTDQAGGNANRKSPGFLTYLVIYVVAAVTMYFASTPEVTGDFTDRQARDFHIAVVGLTDGATAGGFSWVSLAQVRSEKFDLASVAFLLPQGEIKIESAGSDLHKVTVLERHSDWQLVEYHYGNSHDSISRYRAFKDRIEPVAYRVTMHAGMLLSALLLLVPVVIVSALVNAVWKWGAGRRKLSDAPRQ